MLQRLVRTGLRRGLLDGSQMWLAVGVAAAGARLLRRISHSEPEVVYSEELRAGEAIVISHLPANGER